jgi:Tfp pilus assembly protein PilV
MGTGLIGLACLLGSAGCASEKAATQPASQAVSEGAPVSATAEPVAETTREPVSQASSDSLKTCLARITSDSSDGARMIAEQSCRDNETLDQDVVGTATTKSRNRASAGTQGDSLEACMATIPTDATAGQRMLAEASCERDRLSHR